VKTRGTRGKAAPASSKAPKSSDAPVSSGANAEGGVGADHSRKAAHAVKDTPTAKGTHVVKDAPAVNDAPVSATPSTGHAETSRQARAGSGLLSTRRRELPVKRTEGYTEERFLTHQQHALQVERATYLEQASNLKAEAESLVEEMEPGDIQFDDESGEGGTVTVDRERDLALSAQALVAVDEIDHAFAKMATMTYGICENCGRLIPKARLEALPYARLCIDCKSGGLSRR